MTDTLRPIVEDLQLLYELALSVGRDFDLVGNCASFVRILQNRKDIAYGAVWLKPEATGARRSQLVFAHPRARVDAESLPAEHATFTEIGAEKFRSFPCGTPEFDALNVERGVREGAYALFRLRDLGVLKLYSHRQGAFSAHELSQLIHVVERLAVAIEASIAQEELEREIVERQTAQAALAFSEARFRDFADTAADWFWETDAELCMRYVSENYQRATGLERERIFGQTLEAHWRGAEELDAPRRQIVADMEARRPLERTDLRWRGGDGIERIHSFSGKPYFDADAGFIGYRGSARDITAESVARAEQDRLRAQLTQAQKMEAIGQLTGGVAHDFNNILATALGFTELAREAAPVADERLQHYLKEVQLAGERARNLVTQMLTFSRGGTGELGEVRVPEVLEESMRLLRSTMPTTIEVGMAIRAPGATIESDGVSLQQVFMNLCINARDAMDSGKGRLDVVVEEEDRIAGVCDSCHATIEGHRVVLTVRDNGCGIDSDIVDRIFDPFFTTKAPGKGSGMGLSMVHGIVHRHHGHVQVSGRKGEGTTIRVHWPARTGANGRPDAIGACVRPLSGHGERILIVDDEVSIGGFLAEILSRRGYRAEALVDPHVARARVLEYPCPFELLLTDLTMPGLTGLDLISELRAKHGDVPVVLCSGFGDSVRESGPLDDATVFLQKPVTSSDLLEEVQGLLSRRGDKRVRNG